MSNVISCAQYDHFEIVCMHHYEVELTLKSGELVTGIARNVKVVKETNQRKEVIELLVGQNETQLVELNHIDKLKILKENPHFHEVKLT